MLRLHRRTATWLLSLLAALIFLLGGALWMPLSARMDRSVQSASTAITTAPVPIVEDSVEERSVGSGLICWADNCVGEEFGTQAALKRKPAGGGPEQTLKSIKG